MLKYFLLPILFAVSFNQTCSIEKVSIINLIATPEKYDKKLVNVKGFFNNEFESRVLFLDECSAEKNITENGVTLFFDSTINPNILSKYQSQYIEIEGLFNMAKSNNRNTYTHYISKIYKISIIK